MFHDNGYWCFLRRTHMSCQYWEESSIIYERLAWVREAKLFRANLGDRLLGLRRTSQWGFETIAPGGKLFFIYFLLKGRYHVKLRQYFVGEWRGRAMRKKMMKRKWWLIHYIKIIKLHHREMWGYHIFPQRLHMVGCTLVSNRRLDNTLLSKLADGRPPRPVRQTINGDTDT